MPVPSADHAGIEGEPKPLLTGAQCVGCFAAFGDVGANDQHSADATGLRFIVDRRVAVGPPDVLALAVARDRHQRLVVPCRAFAGHHEVDLRADDVPDFRPAFTAALPKRARMPLRSHRLAVSVIVKLDEVRSPPDEHGMPGGEQQSHAGAQALRPGVGRAEWRRRPVMSAHEGAHFAAARQKIQFAVCFHVGTILIKVGALLLYLPCRNNRPAAPRTRSGKVS